jgi:hypothetical protein
MRIDLFGAKKVPLLEHQGGEVSFTMLMDYTCMEIVMTSEEIGFLKVWNRRWFIGVVSENDTGSVTQKLHKRRTECDKENSGGI